MLVRDGHKLRATTYAATAGVIAALGFFSLFGVALVAFWIATVLPRFATPGEPYGAWKEGFVGIAWLAVCVLGVATRSTVTIDPDRRVIELRLSRFGVGTPRVVPFADVVRVGIRKRLTGSYRHRPRPRKRAYEVLVEARGLSFEGQALVVSVGSLETARADGDLVATALGLPCVDMTVG